MVLIPMIVPLGANCKGKQGKLAKPRASRKDLISFSNVEFQAKRLKFSLKKGSRERLFTQLQVANDRMRSLLESSDHIAVAHRTRGTTKHPYIMSKKINEFWRHAKRLHEALSKAWECGCTSHVANLQLQHRISDKVEFDVLFNVSATPTHRGWQETRIKMIPGAVTLGTVAITINPPTSTTPFGGGYQVGVKAPSLPVASVSNLDNANAIKDLCSTLSTNCPGCFGFLDEDEHRFMVYPRTPTTSLANHTTVTLGKLLQDAHVLTRRKRYALALTLASSYLQLGSTPWLSSPFRNDSIVFLQDPMDPDLTQLEHPYIRREISKQPSVSDIDSISSLGIRLLELCFGTPLESNKFRMQLPTGDATSGPILDYAAAIQWSKMVSEEAGPEFAEAIEWCLHAKQGSDGSWRKGIWTHVIVPLDACHRQVSQRPPLL
jgi:hypothetical protein